MSSFGTMANPRGSELKKKIKGNTTAQLEVESRRMEERLHMLKQMMSVEKARREVEGGFLWESGQKGALLRQHKDQPVKTVAITSGSGGKKRNKEKIRVKILSDKNEVNLSNTEIVRCGQCDKSSASLSCVECLENYCQLCYAKFHHKGALASHHAKPVIPKSKYKGSPHKPVNTGEMSCKKVSPTVTYASEQQSHTWELEGNSLLDGTYDEEESAASFQQALAEWRAQAGKTSTSNETQASPMRDSANATMSSEGTQVGQAEIPKWKLHPQIQFSGKSGGVSYFEQLMMKRHRFDPMFLSRAKHTTTSDEVQPVSLTVDDCDLPSDEDTTITPSEYNIFYSPEVVESSSEVLADSVNTNSTPAAAGIEIVELDIGQSMTSASPNDVTIKPSQLPEQEQISLKSKTATKPSGGTKRPKSIGKKRAHSSGSKSKSVPVNSHRASTALSVHAPSKVSELDILASVKKAWTQHSDLVQLSKFFLQGVESKDITNVAEPRRAEKQKTFVFSKSRLSSTVWLPGNSTSEALVHVTIDPATDLPPLVNEPRPQSQPMLCSSNDSQSESNDEDIHDLALSVSNIEDFDIWERQERDEEDDTALENLAWELASTVDYEGRLTRCESELVEGEGDVDATALSSSPVVVDDQGAFPLTDLSQVMSEFELYMNQQSDLEQNLVEQ